MKRIFEVENRDFARSPFTGMTKGRFIGCVKYILERAFSHVRATIRLPVFTGGC